MANLTQSGGLTMREAVALVLRHAPALQLAAAALILGSAFAMQYLGGLQPCTLCLYQRWPYGAVILLAGAALLMPQFSRLLLALIGLTWILSAGLGFWHVGVEQKWVAGTSSCGVIDTATTLEALRAQLLDAPIVRCDEVAWSLFGISLAGYNVIFSLALAGFAALAVARR